MLLKADVGGEPGFIRWCGKEGNCQTILDLVGADCIKGMSCNICGKSFANIWESLKQMCMWHPVKCTRQTTPPLCFTSETSFEPSFLFLHWCAMQCIFPSVNLFILFPSIRKSPLHHLDICSCPTPYFLSLIRPQSVSRHFCLGCIHLRGEQYSVLIMSVSHLQCTVSSYKERRGRGRPWHMIPHQLWWWW